MTHGVLPTLEKLLRTCLGSAEPEANAQFFRCSLRRSLASVRKLQVVLVSEKEPMATAQQTFLPQLADSFKRIDHGSTQIRTRDFAVACEAILPIFDHLGASVC